MVLLFSASIVHDVVLPLVDPSALHSGKTPITRLNQTAAQLAAYILNLEGRRSQIQPINILAESKTAEHLMNSLKDTNDRTAIYIEDELTATLAGIGNYKSATGALRPYHMCIRTPMVVCSSMQEDVESFWQACCDCCSGYTNIQQNQQAAFGSHFV
jgi:hypothetical protein